MNQMTNNFRQRIAESFIGVLEEKALHWKSGWQSFRFPINAYTNKNYKGLNKFSLYLAAASKVKQGETPDNRWATFNQIQNKGWRVRKGAVGEKVEYWQPYDFNQKQPIEWSEFYKRRTEDGINLIAKYYTVFNGKDIIGIPELETKKEGMVMEDALIRKIADGMQLEISNDGGDRAYYDVLHDKIHLPLQNAFYNTYAYNSTVLHELSHATGAEQRLNREMKNHFGTEKYAYEELVAEISSCFMGEHLEQVETEQHIENHKAYVQSWVKAIKENPDVLIHAIRDAEKAANYLEYHAGILSKEEYQKSLQDSLEVPQSRVKESTQEQPENTVKEEAKKPEEIFQECLKANDTEGLKKILLGLHYHVQDAVFDSNYNVVKGQSAEARLGDYSVSVKFNNTYNPHMAGEIRQDIVQHIDAVICEKDVVKKVVSLNQSKSKSVKNAKTNYEEMLKQWKALTNQDKVTIPFNLKQHLKRNGYQPTPALVKRIEQLNEMVGKQHTVKDIWTACKENTLRDNPKAHKLAQSIGKMLQAQELVTEALIK